MKTAPVTATDPRLARLPKWARDRLETLERELRIARRERDEARLDTAPAASSAVLDPYAEIPVGLGNARVRFKVGDENREEWIDAVVKVDVVSGRRYLELLGGTSLRLSPQVTNVLHVEVSRR